MSYATLGYEVVDGVFSAEAIAAVRVAIREALDRLARAMIAPFERSRPELPLDRRLEEVARQDPAYASALYHGVLADAHLDPRVAALRDHPGLREAVEARLAGYRMTGTTLRLRANVPSLPLSRSRWHQDVADETPTPYGCETVRLACWVPLVDVDAERGALELIPGRYEAPIRHEGGVGGFFHIPEERLPKGRRVSPPMPLGSALFLDRLIPHQALPLGGDAARWSLVLWVKGVR
jgi:hypothetical protein